MLITLVYTIIGGVVFYLIEKVIIKRKKTDLRSFHKIIGCINLCLAVVFLGIYFVFPNMFSNDVNISNQFIYICFSILASYYYILAAPLSIANVFIILKTKSEHKVILFINIIACILLVISFLLFLQ